MGHVGDERRQCGENLTVLSKFVRTDESQTLIDALKIGQMNEVDLTDLWDELAEEAFHGSVLRAAAAVAAVRAHVPQLKTGFRGDHEARDHFRGEVQFAALHLLFQRSFGLMRQQVE